MKLLNLVVLLLSLFVFTACSDSDDNSGNAAAQANWVNWDTVPAHFNPQIDQRNIVLGAAQRMRLNLFSFDDDVRVIYSSEQLVGRATLKIYKVYDQSASWGSLSTDQKNNAIEINNYGSYACSITVKNGAITMLEGGCYVRVEVVLAVGAEVEVYNQDTLLTQRFIPMLNSEFIQAMNNQSWIEGKIKVIDEYLYSYQVTKKTPYLVAVELEELLKDAAFTDDKFALLGRLHQLVMDRESLRPVIQNVFNTFDQAKAYQMVGIPMSPIKL